MNVELERTLIIASALLVAAVTVAMLDELKNPQGANTEFAHQAPSPAQAECAK